MATINGKEVNQIIFNGQEVFVLVNNNDYQVQWVKPNHEQTFTVYGTTGSVQQSSPSGLSQYFTYQTLYVGSEITSATITGDNSVSVNQGMLSYTLYSVRANQNVSARITLKKYRSGTTTISVTGSTIAESLGRYPFSGSINIGTGWTSVTLGTMPNGVVSQSINYNSSTGVATVTGYVNRAGRSATLTINYNNG